LSPVSSLLRRMRSTRKTLMFKAHYVCARTLRCPNPFSLGEGIFTAEYPSSKPPPNAPGLCPRPHSEGANRGSLRSCPPRPPVGDTVVASYAIAQIQYQTSLNSNSPPQMPPCCQSISQEHPTKEGGTGGVATVSHPPVGVRGQGPGVRERGSGREMVTRPSLSLRKNKFSQNEMSVYPHTL